MPRLRPKHGKYFTELRQLLETSLQNYQIKQGECKTQCKVSGTTARVFGLIFLNFVFNAVKRWIQEVWMDSREFVLTSIFCRRLYIQDSEWIRTFYTL